MTNGWQTVSIGEVAKPIERAEAPLADTTYRQIGVRLWGQGAYERGSIDGSQTKYATLSRVESGDIIANKIWARNGSVAVVSDKLAGCFGSGEFPTFAPDRKRVEPKWFHWMMKTKWFWQACDEKSQGTSGKNRIRPEKFLEIEIPIPSLDEQRRIVERVETLAAHISKAQSIRGESSKEVEILLARATTYALDEQGWEIQRLENVLKESPRNGFAPQSKVEGNGKRMLRINAVSSSPNRFVDLSAFNIVDVPEEKANPFYMQNNEVFVVRYNGDINRVAKAAIYKAKDDEKIIFPDKLIRLRANEEIILPDYLVFALSSRKVRSQIEELGKTTAGNIGISGSNIKSFMIPVPPLDEQRRIVAYLDSVQARLASLRELQSATGEELDALLPSVLDRAFKGEL